MTNEEKKTTEASTITPPAKFQGWRRPRGGRWQIVAQADAEADCFRKLLVVAQRTVTGAYDQVILPYPQEP